MEAVTNEKSRREFLTAALGMAAGAVALSGCKTDTPPRGEGVKAGAFGTRPGMIIDTRRCVGCKACTVACKAENHTPPGVAYCWVTEEAKGQYPVLSRLFQSQRCNQCANPPCVPVCPVDPDAKGHRATWKRDEDGIVVIDYDRCIGCGQCVDACPYGARSLDEGKSYYSSPTAYEGQASPEYALYLKREAGKPPIDKARKCTFCLHRVTNGLPPSCAATCMGHAIHFGDLGDPEATCLAHGENLRDILGSGKATRLKEEKGTEPAIYYLT